MELSKSIYLHTPTLMYIPVSTSSTKIMISGKDSTWMSFSLPCATNVNVVIFHFTGSESKTWHWKEALDLNSGSNLRSAKLLPTFLNSCASEKPKTTLGRKEIHQGNNLLSFIMARDLLKHWEIYHSIIDQSYWHVVSSCSFDFLTFFWLFWLHSST